MPKVTKQNIIELQGLLLAWFLENRRDFPWRKPQMTHYQIIIAEVLLQRTKAETINRFYANFIECFPDWLSIRNSDIDAIEEFLRPIGLYKQRAGRLKRLANEMVIRNEKFPKNREELEKIPFLGQYIANAVELLIFNRPTPLIDVNMARFLERYFHKRKMADIRYDTFLQKLSHEVVNHSKSKDLNWAILDYASLICKASNPLCYSCIFIKKCTYFKMRD